MPGRGTSPPTLRGSARHGEDHGCASTREDVFQDSGIYSRNLLEMNASDERASIREDEGQGVRENGP